MYVMEIGGVDIVLGSKWFETLGTVRLNLREQFIRFYENGRKYKPYSIKFHPPQIVSCNQMENIIINGDKYFFLHYYSMEGKTDERQNTNTHELDQLLGEHNDIIQNHPHGI